MSNYRGQRDFNVRSGLQGAAKNTNYIFGGTVINTKNYADQFIYMAEGIQTKNFNAALETCRLNLCCNWGLYVVMGILVFALGRYSSLITGDIIAYLKQQHESLE